MQSGQVLSTQAFVELANAVRAEVVVKSLQRGRHVIHKHSIAKIPLANLVHLSLIMSLMLPPIQHQGRQEGLLPPPSADSHQIVHSPRPLSGHRNVCWNRL